LGLGKDVHNWLLENGYTVAEYKLRRDNKDVVPIPVLPETW